MTKISKTLVYIIISIIVFMYVLTERADQLQYARNVDWLEVRVEACYNDRKSLYDELIDLHAIVEQARYLTSCTPAGNNKVMICMAEEGS